jgi:hypothetical protein
VFIKVDVSCCFPGATPTSQRSTRLAYGFTVKITLFEEPLYDAVKSPVLLLRIEPVEIGNTPVLEPAATATNRGSSRPRSWELSLTLISALAGAERITVQVPFEFEARVVGLHCRAATTRAVDRVRFTVLELPLKAAVKLPARLVLNGPVLTVKVPAVDPAVTDTDAGTFKADSPLLLRATTATSGIALDSVTVQSAVVFGPSIAGMHCKEEIAGVAARLKLTLCEVLL